jgi:dihydrolipoamide dehydrogenase
MEEIRLDIAIIGTGTSGMGAYREAKKFTDSIALIEGDQYGTTCARVGCMPSKLLIAPAEARYRANYFERFGLVGAVPAVDGAAVMKRVRDERDRFVGFVVKAVEGFDEAHRIRAHATFVDDHRLQLSDGRMLRAERIIVTVGSRPFIGDQLAPLGDRVITSDELFYLHELPSSIAVFGAGIIGLELGQALHRLGVRMRLFGRGGSIGPLTDPAIIAYAAETFAQEYPILPDAQVEGVMREGDQVRVDFMAGGGRVTEYFDMVLAATGRRSNVDGLGLEHTSLQLDERGIPLYNPDTMQCGDSHIFIAGDADGDLALLHEASDEGRLAGENGGRYPEVYRRARKTPLSIVFSDPQIGLAGKTYRELTESGIEFATGTVDFEDQGRSRVMLVNKGLLHIYGDPHTGEVLGAEMIGPHHEHLAHLIAWSIQSRMNAQDMVQMPFYHPVIEEGLRSGLRTLLAAMNMAPAPPLRCIDCGPGG